MHVTHSLSTKRSACVCEKESNQSVSCGLDFVSIIDGTESVQPLCRSVGRSMSHLKRRQNVIAIVWRWKKFYVTRIALALNKGSISFNRWRGQEIADGNEHTARYTRYVRVHHPLSYNDMQTSGGVNNFLDLCFSVESKPCMLCCSFVRMSFGRLSKNWSISKWTDLCRLYNSLWTFSTDDM